MTVWAHIAKIKCLGSTRKTCVWTPTQAFFYAAFDFDWFGFGSPTLGVAPFFNGNIIYDVAKKNTHPNCFPGSDLQTRLASLDRDYRNHMKSVNYWPSLERLSVEVLHAKDSEAVFLGGKHASVRESTMWVLKLAERTRDGSMWSQMRYACVWGHWPVFRCILLRDPGPISCNCS